MRSLAAIAVFLLIGAGIVVALWTDDPAAEGPRQPETGLDVGRVLGGTSDPGFERAVEPRDFRFPADHGPHPAFRTEWWYLTGNLQGQDGRPFGYQFTIFRTALTPELKREERESRWATNQLYMGHFALTDVEAERFHAFERFGRGALGLAGARAEPFAVWVGPWRMEGIEEPGLWPLRLRAAGRDQETGAEIALDLVLEPAKDLVLQGEEGLSRKGTAPGNASYYYSYTRVETRGTVRAGGREHAVTGTSWLDREWSTSVLEDGQVGWDWFALQLDDGRDLMLYHLRQPDGTPHPMSAGKLVARDGTGRSLSRGEFRIEVLDRWRSADGAALYPSRWRIEVPSEGLSLEVEPRLADQELKLTVRYWEGSVEVSGTGREGPFRGVGYAELTGYAGLRKSPEGSSPREGSPATGAAEADPAAASLPPPR